jgi:hypothetical protein
MSAPTRCLASVLLLVVAACGGDDDPPRQLTREQLLDPENCKDCHPKHYDEWSASMHAYASRDPVFIAMNKRMQEQVPENAQFCVQCHAPMALRENKITNFADLSNVPKPYQGVTCYFCHNAVNVKDDHFNANIDLANDTIMRGALDNPVQSAAAHGVSPTKSKWHDPNGIESSTLCGTCHDIKTPSGVSIERTFQEYLMSVSSKPGAGKFNSCQDCHMKKKPLDEPAAEMVQGVGNRKVHSHLFPAVDIALTPDLPNQDALRTAIEKSELQACTMSQFTVEYGDGWIPGEPFRFVVTIEQLAGHNFPSGASADRRLWVEILATDDTGQVVLETGRIADGEVEQKPMGDPKYDSQFLPFRDHLIDAAGNETHMFWEAASYKSDLLPFATNPDPAVTHSATRSFMTKTNRPPTRIEMWLRLRPMGIDVLQDLVKSGHLDPALISAMPTLTVAHQEAILDPEKQSYSYKELTTDAECKVFQTLSDLTAQR